MSVLDKLMFWKKEPDFGDMGKDDSLGKIKFGEGSLGLDKGPFGEQKETGNLGLGRDMTSGLGGTGNLGAGSSDFGSGLSQTEMERGIDIKGYGYESVRPKAEEAPFAARPLYPQQGPQMQAGTSRDTELILSKLDTIKAMIENINHRLDALERNQQKRGRSEW